MVGELLILEDLLEPSIVQLTLNRPEKRNALNIPLLKELAAHLEKLHRDNSVRVIIVNGAGPVFCSGLDLVEASQPETEKESANLIHKCLSQLFHMPQVTIAAIHGAAIAGGAGLASASDFVLAADDIRYGFPEVRKGLIPAQVMTLLHRQISERHLREIVLFGEMMDAKKAYELGLINRLVPAGKLMDEALKIAQSALEGAPAAIKESKRLIEDLYPNNISGDFVKALKYHHLSRHSLEAKEGIQAFLEKRKPFWSNKHE